MWGSPSPELGVQKQLFVTSSLWPQVLSQCLWFLPKAASTGQVRRIASCVQPALLDYGALPSFDGAPALALGKAHS